MSNIYYNYGFLLSVLKLQMEALAIKERQAVIDCDKFCVKFLEILIFGLKSRMFSVMSLFSVQAFLQGSFGHKNYGQSWNESFLTLEVALDIPNLQTKACFLVSGVFLCDNQKAFIFFSCGKF